MARPMIDIAEIAVGSSFGRLTVIDGPFSDGHSRFWKCSCSCRDGAECMATTGNLRSGSVQSCGCLRKEKVADRGRRVGAANGKAGAKKQHATLAARSPRPAPVVSTPAKTPGKQEVDVEPAPPPVTTPATYPNPVADFCHRCRTYDAYEDLCGDDIVTRCRRGNHVLSRRPRSPLTSFQSVRTARVAAK